MIDWAFTVENDALSFRDLVYRKMATIYKTLYLLPFNRATVQSLTSIYRVGDVFVGVVKSNIRY